MKAATHTKKKSWVVVVREVGEDDSPHSLPAQDSLASPQLGQVTEATSRATAQPKKVCSITILQYLPYLFFPKVESVKWNPVYLFYKVVSQNANGMVGDPRDKHDKHYKCYHGNHKVLTITRAMKSSLNGMHAFKTTTFFMCADLL
jgi:hypothetical protein